MTPAEAASLQAGAAILATHLRGNADDRNLLIEQFVPISEAADSFTRLAVTAASMAAIISGRTPEGVLTGLDEHTEELLPGIEPAWTRAVELARAVIVGGPSVQQAAGRMDVPTAVTSSFDLAAAAVREMARLTAQSPDEAAAMLALGAARET